MNILIIIILMILALVSWYLFINGKCNIITPLTFNVMQALFFIYLINK
jgi:hypothetical protein